MAIWKSKKLSRTESEGQGMEIEPIATESISVDSNRAEESVKSSQAHPDIPDPVETSKPHPLVSPEENRSSPIHEGEIFFPREIVHDLPASERFRIIRAKIERLNLLHDNYRVIAVTSSVQSEGKSVVSANLARALSLDPLGKTVIVDCDLRRPNVHSFFAVPRRPGLTDAVYRSIPLEAIVIPITHSLDVVPAGSELIDPAQGVERPEFAQFISDLRQRYRYVVLDCPPVLLCPEPITISLIADTSLLVVRAWHTAKRLVKDAIEHLGRQRILGIVLNEGDDSAREYLDYGYYGYRYSREKPKDSKD